MNEPKFKRGDLVRMKLDDSPDLIVNAVFRANNINAIAEVNHIGKIIYQCIYVDDNDKICLTPMTLAEEILELVED